MAIEPADSCIEPDLVHTSFDFVTVPLLVCSLVGMENVPSAYFS